MSAIAVGTRRCRRSIQAKEDDRKADELWDAVDGAFGDMDEFRLAIARAVFDSMSKRRQREVQRAFMAALESNLVGFLADAFKNNEWLRTQVASNAWTTLSHRMMAEARRVTEEFIKVDIAVRGTSGK